MSGTSIIAKFSMPLNAVGKVVEKVIISIHSTIFVSALQSGFIPGDSTVNQLVDI